MSVSGWQIRAVGVTNLTPFPIHFPDNPAAFQWVLPNTVNAVVPVPPGDVIRVNSVDILPGVNAPAGSTARAQLSVFEDPLPPSPGAPAPASAVGVFKSVFFRQVNAGGSNIVPAIGGQTIHVYSLLLSVDTPVAGAFALVSDDSISQILAQIEANTAHSVPFDTKGAGLSAGAALRFSVLAANAAVGCAAIYQQQ
jgi:hypothetical protein